MGTRLRPALTYEGSILRSNGPNTIAEHTFTMADTVAKPPYESKEVPVSEGSDHGVDSENVSLDKEVFDITAVDPILARKMAIINSGIGKPIPRHRPYLKYS